MIKYVNVYIWFLMSVLYTSCKEQGKTDLPKDTIKSETKDVTSSHGPSSIVRTIKQDRNGSIWLASWEGVFRYDGKSFTNITSKVSSARFFSLLEDRKGNFWFASVGSGIFYYDGKSFRNYTKKDGLASDVVTAIYEDKVGNVWFGTAEGASRYDGKSFRNYRVNEGLTFNWNSSQDFTTKERLTDIEQNQVQWIFEDKTGKFWFGTRGYASVYDGKEFTTITNKEGKGFKNVHCIIEDTKGNIWLGGDDGLWRYDGSTFTNFAQSSAIYIIEDKKGNIWTSNVWTLSLYDRKSLSDEKPIVTEIKSPKEASFGILEANDGSIWVGTEQGVYRYDGKTFNDFKEGL